LCVAAVVRLGLFLSYAGQKKKKKKRVAEGF